MKSRLNFKHLLVVIILPFVSLSTIAGTVTPTSGQDKVEALKAEIKKDPKNTKLVVQLAQEFYTQKDYEKVTLLLWKQIDKLDRQAILLLAKAHEARQETGDMIRALNNLISKNDKDFEAYSLLGNAYTMQKKPKEALENYKLAIESNPKFEPPYNALMKMYETRQPPNYYEMRILAQDMIDNMGKKAEYLAKLCEINTNDGTFEAGVTSCRETIQKDPKIADAHVNLGLSMKGMGEDDKAKATLKKAADSFPKSEFAQYTYGHLLEEDKSSIEAMKYFKVGSEADPKSARSWLGLATTSFDIKKYEVALIAYKNACKYDKKNAVAFRKATTVLRNSRVSEWVGKFESASENCTF
ncbi:tetratricopeptide repeat protein [Bdellovibrio sp. KM01]|uniref:tetratricopeptide repeat protein n=1 Tax=Bdellovibrio sp. KM01 TaxID=2748865 RepID=UPI0015E9F598|nr:tetratricopeptide repeat protein [Bdellovibrio sp. KM01]QLY25410.1 tetratricopeptide repeat protein [Bdellovibrio sp. KM01]